jgi:signal peptidase I
VLRWWRVPENDPYLEASITPTLNAGDLILFWRGTKPTFGDLVMCPEPGAPERIVIGRIAGEGGDSIRIKAATVWVNNHRADTERVCEKKEFTQREPKTERSVTQMCQQEVLGNVHQRGDVPDDRVLPTEFQATVPQQHVFLLSDNRLFPYDSREFGAVPRDTCKETVVFRLVSRAGFFDVENRLMFIQ